MFTAAPVAGAEVDIAVAVDPSGQRHCRTRQQLEIVFVEDRELEDRDDVEEHPHRDFGRDGRVPGRFGRDGDLVGAG